MGISTMESSRKGEGLHELIRKKVGFCILAWWELEAFALFFPSALASMFWMEIP